MFLIGLLGFGATSVLCGLAPRHGAADPLPHPPGRRRGAARARLAGPPHGHLPRRGAGSRVRPVGRRLGCHDAPGAGRRAASWSRRSPGGWPSSSTCRSWPSPPTPRGATCTESRNEQAIGPLRLAGRDRRGAWPSAACRSASSTAASGTGPTRWPSSSSASGSPRLVVFPFLMRRRPDPLVPLGLFRSRHFTVTNISTFLIYGALYVYSLLPARSSPRARWATRRVAGGPGGPPRRPPPDALLAALRHPRRALGPRRFMAVGPAVMALGLLWLARTPVDSAAWQLTAGRSSGRGCRRAATSSTCCPASCSSASASRSWSRR